jgi:hypothetical protein
MPLYSRRNLCKVRPSAKSANCPMHATIVSTISSRGRCCAGRYRAWYPTLRAVRCRCVVHAPRCASTPCCRPAAPGRLLSWRLQRWRRRALTTTCAAVGAASSASCSCSMPPISVSPSASLSAAPAAAAGTADAGDGAARAGGVPPRSPAAPAMLRLARPAAMEPPAARCCCRAAGADPKSGCTSACCKACAAALGNRACTWLWGSSSVVASR